ncbi:AAA family ATPase [Geodermatophilus sp. SYSU D00804]
MRPVRLHMDGFGSFREPTTVDFTDTDYFALVGPTGAGKSTVIDAITFALYGTVPRWDNRRVVGWALSPNAARGVVELVFDADGDRYTVARELRRTKSGVTQNARLERFADPADALDPATAVDAVTESLATDSGVTAAVEELLGLSFDHFTQCVVLPQGEFAAFLRANPSARRDTLLKLLGADLYKDIGQRANARAATAATRAATLAEQLTRFGDATADAQAAAEAQVAALADLAATVTGALPRLADAETARAAARAEVTRLAAEADRLAALTPPADLDGLDAQLRAASGAAEAAATAEAAAETADDEARKTLAAAPAKAPLERARADHAEHARRRAVLPEATDRAAAAQAAREAARAAATIADAALEAARAARTDAAAAAQAADAAVDRLEDELRRLTGVTVPEELTAHDQRLQAATETAATAAERLTRAETAEAGTRTALQAAGSRAPLERAQAAIGELGRARAALAPRERERDTADAELTDARGRLARAEETARAAHAQLDAAAVAHRAATLRPHLVAGAPCPVCEQPVATVPGPAEAPELHAAERTATEANTARDRARDAVRAAEARAAHATAQLTAAGDAAGAHAAALSEALTTAGLPADADIAAVRAALGRLDELERALADAAVRLRSAREADTAARGELRRAEAAGSALQARFTAVRDPLVELGAPAATGALLPAWTALATWADEQAAARTLALADARARAADAGTTLAAATRAFAAAEDQADTARRRAAAAAGDAGRAAAELEQLQGRLAELDAALAGAPTDEEAAAALAEITGLEVAAAGAAERLTAARAAHRRAKATLAELSGRVEQAWRALRAARDRLVPLGAPELPGGDVLAGWAALTSWAGTEAGARREALPNAQQAVTDAEAHRAAVGREITAALGAAEVPLPAGDVPLATAAPAAVAAARADAAGEVRRITERRAEAAALTDRHGAAVEEERVAKTLGNLLRSNQFPAWLEAAALDSLVVAASASLAQLSGGQYELTHEGGDFHVVDHADADATRSVRTLSGGETFQASLALALALSDQLSTLAASGAARLDSLFLDEGFGTLDESTLETVAATLENLATSGDRMVGLITHVAALAERVPVRYAVRRTARTSTIARETA